MNWNPMYYWMSREAAAEAALDGRDKRCHYLGPFSWWSLKNDKGFAIGRLSLHLVRWPP